MILGLQIIGVFFALFMMYLTFLYRKRKEFDSKEYMFWMIIWVVFVLISLFPHILDPFTKTLQLMRTMDLLILLGFIFIIGLSFSNHILLKKTQKRVESIVRKMALREFKKKK